MKKYIDKIKQYLYKKEILPIIQKSYSENSLEEIANKMRPVPYEFIKDKLPAEFAKTLKLMLKNE